MMEPVRITRGESYSLRVWTEVYGVELIDLRCTGVQGFCPGTCVDKHSHCLAWPFAEGAPENERVAAMGALRIVTHRAAYFRPLKDCRRDKRSGRLILPIALEPEN